MHQIVIYENKMSTRLSEINVHQTFLWFMYLLNYIQINYLIFSMYYTHLCNPYSTYNMFIQVCQFVISLVLRWYASCNRCIHSIWRKKRKSLKCIFISINSWLKIITKVYSFVICLKTLKPLIWNVSCVRFTLQNIYFQG